MKTPREGPIDLSPLDPGADPDRWGRIVAATLERVDEVMARRPTDPLTQIAIWSRPLTIGALTVIALLIPIELVLEMRESETERIERLVQLSTTGVWSERPDAADLLRTLGSGVLP